MTLQQNLSNAMNAIRYSRDYNLTEFAKELAISRSALQKILDGTANPRIDTIEHIAKQLDMNPLTLLCCSYSEEQMEVALPLLKISDQLFKLPDKDQQKFLELFKALVHLLIKPDK